MTHTCPICRLKIVDPASSKIMLVYNALVHKLCLVDFKLRTGGDWKPWKHRNNDWEADGS